MLTVSLKKRLEIIVEGGWHQRYVRWLWVETNGRLRRKHEGNWITHDTSAWEEYVWQTATVKQRQFIRVPEQKNVTKQHFGLYQQTKI
jgi:hypothetical protein